MNEFPHVRKSLADRVAFLGTLPVAELDRLSELVAVYDPLVASMAEELRYEMDARTPPLDGCCRG